jgi:hypothetical protein
MSGISAGRFQRVAGEFPHFPQFPLAIGQSQPWAPQAGFPTFPPFPPVIWPPTERVVQAADDARAALLKAPMLMKVMPIPCRRRSADIRHNIAQDCQPQSSHGTCNTGASGGALEQRPIRWNRTRFHLIGHKLL